MTALDLSWLTAVLAPRDLAPHPNFSEKATTPASRLAALLAAWGPFLPKDVIGDDEFLRACRDSLSDSSVAVGARALASWVLSNGRKDVGKAVAGALLASVAYSELDEHDSAVQLLSSVLTYFDAESATPEWQLLKAAVLQQRALRSFEMGETGIEDATQVRRLIAAVNRKDFVPFPLSTGVSWSSQQTCTDMAEALADAALAHIAGQQDPLEGQKWQDVVRARPTVLLLKEARRRSHGYQEYLAAGFQAAAASRSRHSEGVQHGDMPVYQSLLFTELLGHPSAHVRRSELAVLRFLASQEDKGSFLQEEAIRLFRHGRDKKRLSAALRRIRESGPLGVLRGDALQVLKRRVGSRRLGDVELVLLAAAAELLTKDEASLALDGVLECIDRPFRVPTSGWQAEAVRLEDVWLAAVALASSADRIDHVAKRLHREVTDIADDDQLLDRMYARTIEGLDWAQVSRATASAWQVWAAGDGAESWPLLASAVRWELRLPDAATSRPAGSDFTLDDLARLLNAVMHNRAIWQSDLSHAARKLVVDHLAGIRQSAAAGVYSFGGLSPADIGVGLALHAGVDCWPEVSSFLLDPHVQREEKTSALERMAHSPALVPSSVVQTLAGNVDALLASAAKNVLGPPAVDPYPAALRAVAALGAISTDRLLTECARLGGSSSASTRVEALRTLSSVSFQQSPPSWTVVFALQQSRDADSAVRAEAARCLAILLGRHTELRTLIVERLVDLLSEDGILVPLLVIRGLLDVKDRVDADRVITTVIENLASNHPASSIRLLAAEYLAA